VLVVDLNGGVEQAREDVAFDVQDPHLRAARLTQTGANVLVCGAISRPLELAIMAAGIEVIPQTCGEVETVLAAYTDGRLYQGDFLMPGCCGRRRRFQGGRGGRGRGGGRGRQGPW